MRNKELRLKAQDYIEANAIDKNTYQVEKAFIDGAKMALELVKESDFLPCVSDRFDDPKFIQNCCISYRHDYGLLDEGTQGLIEAEVKEVMRAIKNNAPYGR